MALFSSRSHSLPPKLGLAFHDPVFSITAATQLHSLGMSAIDSELVSGMPFAGFPDSRSVASLPESTSARFKRRAAILDAKRRLPAA